MIDLGLARISRLLQHTPQTWKAIHVAGTNGKGSICAYLSAMLTASGLSCARFTSPHIIDRWDCVTINEKPVSETVFREAESLVKQRDREGQIGATEFELLTATAFEIFHRQKVEYGVIEVGLGGKLDATNALKHKAVTVIAKIGLDHQSFLGNTLEEIALQKAGIMRAGVPCVVDGSNQASVLQVLRDHAKEVGAPFHCPNLDDGGPGALLGKGGFEPHQVQNLGCAYHAFYLACPEKWRENNLIKLLPVIKQLQWPGRLQMLDISKITSRPQQKVLLDGAHNTQSAEVLAAYVQKHLRGQDGQSVTWVLAATQGKDMDGILGLLLRPGDRVAAVRFEPVDGMPWVKAADPTELLRVASQHGVDAARQHNAGEDVRDALTWASGAAEEGSVVIAGSLYLVSSHTNVNARAMSPPLNHLVIVCGHAIWAGGPKNGWDEGEWLIESYKAGETPTFIEHIKAGVKVLGEDERAVLIFSGGPTRKETQLSEARSYFNLAVANSYFNLIPEGSPATARLVLEERALDSYYNILFSLVEFWRFTGGIWPERITIVSHAFKRTRLVDAHCSAIGFPLEGIDFVGINPPGMDAGSGDVKEDAMRGVQLAVGQWAEDPHGVGEALASKRAQRNCWNVDQHLFLHKQERLRSGVQTRMLEDGTEALVDGGVRPWALQIN
ncbi:FolC bifunctional protein [Diplogelasinospora grovesii]|uniref:FolC bifunctional protein n=1 Tax=Diplogelasinospora grovesii TaxID=303347 RepID=A0AAN6NJN4_9PEZI|nr:FolC bifunctional protein [Diplogelasinospora grovesii]